jgi:hypothetical protein
MAIPIQGRLTARESAPFHLQMTVEPRINPSGESELAGRVVRVFRTDGRLAEGDHVSFQIYVCRPGDEPTGPAYIHEEALARAAIVEAYLFGAPPSCRLAAYEFTLLIAPTDHPVMNSEELEELLKYVGSQGY